MRNRMGCCALCDVEIYEIKARFTEGPQAGDARQIGRPLETCRRLTFALLNGSTADITFCAECAEMADERLREIWRNVCEAFDFERQHLRRLTPEQAAQKDRELAALEHNLPLGVIAVAQPARRSMHV